MGDDVVHLQGEELKRFQARRKELHTVKWKTSSRNDAFGDQLEKLKIDAEKVFNPALEVRSRM
jgi:hypothetical protein